MRCAACRRRRGNLGAGTLTVYAFSSDNWRRPPAEISALMTLLRRYLLTETARLIRSGIRLSVIGRRDRLPRGLAPLIARAEAATAQGQSLHLRVALDYSGRDAILEALAACAGAAAFSRESMAEALGGKDYSDVDLLIRTSGEQRLSDFLLWESAYAELHFTPKLWPDFAGRPRRRHRQLLPPRPPFRRIKQYRHRGLELLRTTWLRPAKGVTSNWQGIGRPRLLGEPGPARAVFVQHFASRLFSGGFHEFARNPELRLIPVLLVYIDFTWFCRD